MNGERLLICGPRDLDISYEVIDSAIDDFQSCGFISTITVLINGRAKGVDTSAYNWAMKNGLNVDSYPITSNDWKTIGRAAGFVRNKKMLVDGKPTIVVAFRNRSTNGTSMMLKLATNAGIKTQVIAVGDDGKRAIGFGPAPVRTEGGVIGPDDVRHYRPYKPDESEGRE